MGKKILLVCIISVVMMGCSSSGGGSSSDGNVVTPVNPVNPPLPIGDTVEINKTFENGYSVDLEQWEHEGNTVYTGTVTDKSGSEHYATMKVSSKEEILNDEGEVIGYTTERDIYHNENWLYVDGNIDTTYNTETNEFKLKMNANNAYQPYLTIGVKEVQGKKEYDVHLELYENSNVRKTLDYYGDINGNFSFKVKYKDSGASKELRYIEYSKHENGNMNVTFYNDDKYFQYEDTNSYSKVYFELEEGYIKIENDKSDDGGRNDYKFDKVTLTSNGKELIISDSGVIYEDENGHTSFLTGKEVMDYWDKHSNGRDFAEYLNGKVNDAKNQIPKRSLSSSQIATIKANPSLVNDYIDNAKSDMRSEIRSIEKENQQQIAMSGVRFLQGVTGVIPLYNDGDYGLALSKNFGITEDFSLGGQVGTIEQEMVCGGSVGYRF